MSQVSQISNADGEQGIDADQQQRFSTNLEEASSVAAEEYQKSPSNPKSTQTFTHGVSSSKPRGIASFDGIDIAHAARGLVPDLDFRAQDLLTWEYTVPACTWDSFRKKVGQTNGSNPNAASALELEYTRRHSLEIGDRLLDLYNSSRADDMEDEDCQDIEQLDELAGLSLAQCEEEENRLELEIEQLQKKKREIVNEKKKEIQTQRELGKRYRDIWEATRAISSHRLKLVDQYSSYRIRTRVLCRRLLKFQQLDATNDAFFIWHSGSIATINNCRLGLLPGHDSDWKEINAALGQAALMLLVVANRLAYRLEPYIVIPMGSFSAVARHGDEQNADPLYCESKSKRKRLEKALVKLLHCVQSLVDNRLKTYSDIDIPYPINDDHIGGVPITLGDGVLWTRAMNYLLSDLKFLLVVSMNAADERRFF